MKFGHSSSSLPLNCKLSMPRCVVRGTANHEPGSPQSFERRMRRHFGKGGAVATKERRALSIEDVFELHDAQIRTDWGRRRRVA